jgi:hypothetical protein
MISSCLRAVVPKGVFGLDLESKNVLGLACRSSKVKAGEYASAVGEGLTWLVEG